MRTAAVIYEARPEFDPTAPIAGLPAIHRLVETFRIAGVQRFVVTGGASMPLVEKRCTRIGAEFLRLKKDASGGETGCVRAAAEYLSDKCERVFFTPADYPVFDAETVRRLAESGAETAYPVFGGARGFPVMVSAEYIPALTSGGGISAFLEENAVKAAAVETDDPGTTARAGEYAGIENLAGSLTLHKLRPHNKPSIEREEGFFGLGTLQMLKLVEETGSLKLTCKIMGMAYSRAWKLTQDMERNLGFKIFNAHPGGRAGGWNSLTPECLDFVERFERFAAECEKSAAEAFDRAFGD